MAESSIDTFAISSHFKELQQEKRKLQNKLDHLRVQRKDLESKQGIVVKQNSLLNQKNENMSRTVNIAKMKVQETQTQVDKLQRMNDELQKSVSQFKMKIKNEEDNKDSELEKFQEKYDKLADNFRGAKKYYVDSVLVKEIENWKSTCDVKKIQIGDEKELLDMITTQLETLKVSKVNVPEEKPPKTIWENFLENNHIAVSIFEEESKAVKQLLRRRNILQIN